jgi:hypothetical protein
VDRSLEDVRDLLSDIQITFLELDPSGERLVIGLIDFGGYESRVTAEGLYQFSLSRVPGDQPPFTILGCTITQLARAELEKHIPGYGFTYVRWPDDPNSAAAINVRLEGDVVLDFTCVTLRRE